MQAKIWRYSLINSTWILKAASLLRAVTKLQIQLSQIFKPRNLVGPDIFNGQKAASNDVLNQHKSMYWKTSNVCSLFPFKFGHIWHKHIKYFHFEINILVAFAAKKYKI